MPPPAAAGGAPPQGRGRGTGPVPAPLEHLNNPHGVWLDTRDAAKPMLLVADRGNRRIVRYTLDDKPVDIVEGTLRRPSESAARRDRSESVRAGQVHHPARRLVRSRRQHLRRRVGGDRPGHETEEGLNRRVRRARIRANRSGRSIRASGSCSPASPDGCRRRSCTRRRRATRARAGRDRCWQTSRLPAAGRSRRRT